MRARRSLLGGTAAVGALALLAACGNSGGVGGADTSEETEQTATDDGPVELSYWTWFPPQATLEAAVEAFEAENPNITIELRTFENADYQQQLPLALSGGESLDVVGVQVSAMTNSVKDHLRPVDDWAGDWLDGVDPAMVEQTAAVASDDVLYSVPMGSIGSPIVYYNADLLESSGAEVPETADEWNEAVQAITETHPDVMPVVFTGEPWWQEEMLFGIAEQTAPGLSDDIIHGDGEWTQDALVDGLAAYKSLFDDGTISTDVLGLQGSRPSELFSSGEAAFLIDGSWQNSLLSQDYREANGIGVEDVGAMPLPVVEAGGEPAARSLTEGGLAIPSSSTNVEAASAFVEFMVSDTGADVWAKDLVLVPSLTGFELPDSVLTSEAAVDGFDRAAEVIANPTSMRDSQQDFLNQVEGNAILDVLRGTQTPEEAAQHMQDEWTSGRYPHGDE
ncbi:extracellular solute-binding protein [Isoptericola halotolerans]|uniref:ABC transporter substrate-binding protein n=1 Tax=Isoptericola halotolerans TaxID=300560 RepID=UPI00388D5C9D